MSIFLFLETILFPLPNFCYLLMTTALTLTVWMGGSTSIQLTFQRKNTVPVNIQLQTQLYYSPIHF